MNKMDKHMEGWTAQKNTTPLTKATNVRIVVNLKKQLCLNHCWTGMI